MSARPLSVFVVAGEASGDLLGAAVVRALRERLGAVSVSGIGGPGLIGEGLKSLFPMADLAVMGIGPVLRRLPSLLDRIARATAAAAASPADVVLLIDSPDFTHRVARRLKRLRPDLPIVVYVSPTVWAWRPGRAKAMARFCDHLLALLPFEPEAHRLLGGPPTTYVGHPAAARLAELRPGPGERSPTPRANGAPLRLVVLPGSRRSEVSRLMDVFGAAVARLGEMVGPLEVTLPAVDHVRHEIDARVTSWTVRPSIVAGEPAKLAAFRSADLALAASGTVTLELALARVPMVVAYKLDWLMARARGLIDVPRAVRPLLTVRSIVLPNLIAGEAAVPELIHEAATPDALAAALAALATDGPERRRQLAAFERVAAVTAPVGAVAPARAAAEAILAQLSAKRTLPLR